jgi:hypothetical protein
LLKKKSRHALYLEKKCALIKENGNCSSYFCLLLIYFTKEIIVGSAAVCRLVHEASSELRSCGWTDEVQSFMRDRKRLCVRQGARNPPEALLRFF